MKSNKKIGILSNCPVCAGHKMLCDCREDKNER